MPSPNKSIRIQERAGFTYQNIRSSDGVVLSSGSSVGDLAWTFEDILSTTSTRTPNFARLKAWQLPVNPYNKHITYVNAPKAPWTRKVTTSPGLSYQMQQWLGNVWQFSSPYRDPTLATEDPTQRLYSKLRDAISEVKADAGTSMAELSKTASHVAHTAQRVAKALTALRKGRFGDFANALGTTYQTSDVKRFKRGWEKAYAFDLNRKVPTSTFRRSKGESRLTDFCADTWLEYQYGWKPLFKEMHDLAEATASGLIERQLVLRKVSVSVTLSRNCFVSYKSADQRVYESSHSFRKNKMGVAYRIPNGVISTANAFGLNNPAVVAWELVPFSFVVDWFLPIGDLLGSLTAFSGLEFHSGYITGYHRHDTVKRLTPDSVYQSGATSYQTLATSVGSTCIEFDFTRTKITSFPSMPFPEFKDPRSFSHATSAVALLQSLFLRK